MKTTTRQSIFKKMRREIGPTVVARKNANALATIVGGVAEDLGPRCVVFTYKSKKLRHIEGSAECRGSTVTVTLVDLSVSEVGSMLATLVLLRGEKKRHEARQALRDVVRAKLAAGTPKVVAPLPPPRYDNVFEEGTSWLDDQ